MNKNLILVFLLVGLCLNSSGCQSVTVRRDEDNIRKSFLKETPIGTPMKEVETLVKSKEWSDVKISYKQGMIRYLGPNWKMVNGKKVFGPARPDWETKGAQSISATLGDYISFPVGFTTMVVADWGFNEKGELVDIWIRKSTDAP